MDNKPSQEIQLRARIERSEFVLDPGRIVPGEPEVKILTRVLTTPLQANQLRRALTRNIERVGF